MVRIGKIVTFDGSRETIADKLTKGIKFLNLTGINFSFVTDNTINIYGEQADLVALRDLVIQKGFSFTLGGNAPPEPVEIPDPEPTANELTRDQEVATAFNNVMETKRNEFWALVEAEYNNIKSTAEPFRRVFDIKHLRQKA